MARIFLEIDSDRRTATAKKTADKQADIKISVDNRPVGTLSFTLDGTVYHINWHSEHESGIMRTDTIARGSIPQKKDE